MAIPRTPLRSTQQQPTPAVEDDEDILEQDLPQQDIPPTLESMIRRMQHQLDEQAAEIQRLRTANSASGSPVADESRHNDSSHRQESPPPFNYPRLDPKVPKPPEFSGKVSEFRNFMSQCTLTFTMCPNTYVTDEHKVLFIISLLRGNALTWARNIPETRNHPLRHDYPAFKKALTNLYLDRNLKLIAEGKLTRLRQTKSAAAYAVEFQSLVALLDLDNEAMCLLFYEKLKSTVKDAIVIVGRAKKFHELVDQAITIDQRQHQRTLEDKNNASSNSNSNSNSNNRSSGNSSSNSSRYDKKSNSQGKSNNSSSNSSGNSSNNSPSGNSSNRPRGPISDAEKERRRKNNLCFYCGKPEHNRKNCPELANNSNSNSVNATDTNAYHSGSSLTHHRSSTPSPMYPPPENWQSQDPSRSDL
jgi:hypothetical protein